MERYKTIKENAANINIGANFLQVIEQTDEEKFAMYNKLTKKELIAMLIEANKHLNIRPPRLACNFFMSGSDTSGRCNNCGKQQWEH